MEFKGYNITTFAVKPAHLISTEIAPESIEVRLPLIEEGLHLHW
jgi:hypothetical protein